MEMEEKYQLYDIKKANKPIKKTGTGYMHGLLIVGNVRDPRTKRVKPLQGTRTSGHRCFPRPSVHITWGTAIIILACDEETSLSLTLLAPPHKTARD